jgi:lysophospholipase L1-like esterase
MVAQSIAATSEDVIGIYELTCKETFNAKGYGNDQSIDSVQLVLRADGTFILGDTEGTFFLNPKGKKILLQIGESSLDTFEDGCAEIISDLAFEKGTSLEPWEITCVILKVKISKIKIGKKTAKAKGKAKVTIEGRASFEVDGDLKQKKFSYKNLCKISNDEDKPNILFSDDFSTDSTSAYTVTDTVSGAEQFDYDTVGKRVRVLTGNDSGLKFSRSLPSVNSANFSVDFLPTQLHPSGGMFELILRQDADNYYRLFNSDGYGAGTLRKVVRGVIVDEVSLSREYTQNTSYGITISFSPKQSLVSGFGANRTINTDTTSVSVTSFEMNLHQQDAYFDNLIFTDQPFISITSPQDYHIQSGTSLTVNTYTDNLPTGLRVRFTLKDNVTSETHQSIDATAPFSHRFSGLRKHEHTVEAVIVDETLTPVSGEPSIDRKISIGVGDYYVAFGDSITFGAEDDVNSDNVSEDLRNNGVGYPPILNDLLTSDRGYPHTVVNAGIGGEESLDGLARLQNVIDSNPEAMYFLILFGTNDSHGTMPVPSGLNASGGLLNPGDAGYDGSFLDNMQQIIDAIIASGKTPILAKVPITLGPCSVCAPFADPDTASRNILIQDYNTVIDALVFANGIGITPPDFYGYFRANQNRLADNLHPDGIGYQSMANLWFYALTP